MATKKETKNAHYTAETYKINKLKKLERALKRNPENKQIEQAMKDIRPMRKKPVSPYWKKNMIQTAKIMKKFTGKFDKGYFNTNDKDIESAALKVRNEHLFHNLPSDKGQKSWFSLGQRAHNSNGELVWG